MARSSRFCTRRGRPSSRRPGIDYGTPELAAKRAHGLTAEWLDLLSQEQTITTDMHRCGIRFRWLYTVRFGSPGVRALDITGTNSGHHSRTNDEEWKRQREEEYRLAAESLVRENALATVIHIAVLNQLPSGTHKSEWLPLLRSGLHALHREWKREYAALNFCCR